MKPEDKKLEKVIRAQVKAAACPKISNAAKLKDISRSALIRPLFSDQK
ncbi:MAG: hypothetical protein LRZ84_01425 [Desertifilum sp.]|nr:hypothetical protein [Desertifilum sp.]